MPAPQFQPEDQTASATAGGSLSRADRFRTKLGDCESVSVEPHRLQGEIESRWLAPGRPDVRWSLRQTLAFCLLTCGSFWAVSIYGFFHLIG